MKRLFLIIFSLFINKSLSQEYYYNEIYKRDDLGKFNKIDKNGCFTIKNDSIYLFEQKLKIYSKRPVFGQKSNNIGQLYFCSDSMYYYTLFITTTDELYFYTREKEMLKFKLIKQ